MSAQQQFPLTTPFVAIMVNSIEATSSASLPGNRRDITTATEERGRISTQKSKGGRKVDHKKSTSWVDFANIIPLEELYKMDCDALSELRTAFAELYSDGVAYVAMWDRWVCINTPSHTEMTKEYLGLKIRIKNLRSIYNRINRIIYYWLSKGVNPSMLTPDFNQYLKQHWYVASKILNSINASYIKQVLAERERSIKRAERKAYINARKNDFSVLSEQKLGSNFDFKFNLTTSDSYNKYYFKKHSKASYQSMFNYKNLRDDNDTSFVICDKAKRKPNLIIKIKNIIYLYKLNRSKFCYCDIVLSDPLSMQYYVKLSLTRNNLYYNRTNIRLAVETEAQMDSIKDDKGVDNVDTLSAGNVTLTADRDASEGVPDTSKERVDWCNLSSSDLKAAYKELTNRWLLVKNFEWNNTNSRDTTIMELDLPKDYVVNVRGNTCNVPNTIPFRVHRYFKCDISIRVQINANKFQIGQLQGTWFYEPWNDANFNSRDNIYSCSQSHHMLISANTSNEGVLEIPFKYHLPYIHTRSRSDMGPALSMGRFILKVLNPLTVGNSGPQKCFGSVFMKLNNCEFTGMIDGSIDPVQAEPQMLPILGNVVKMAQVLSDTNRDNPPDPTPPNYLVPTASHSWSFGTGASEPLHSLRLDARGMTPHPDTGDDELRVDYITSKFGLVDTVTWTQNDLTGTVLYQCNAAPLLEKSKYAQTSASSTGQLATYAIPPVGVISSLFNYWRGSIEFRFDVISSQFHTGRILLAYIPGATENSNVTLDQARGSPHMAFTLNEQSSFTYRVPFISNKPYWPRLYSGNYSPATAIAPSRIYVYVLNPLIPMQSVPDKVYINIYMRAGPDFEVAVPIQPALGLGQNKTVLYDNIDIIHALDSSNYPYYAGVWHSFNNSLNLVMRDKTTSDGRAWFDGRFESKGIFYYECIEPSKMCHWKDGDTLRTVQWSMLVPDGSNWIMVCLKSEKACQAVCDLVKTKKKSWSDPLVAPYLLPASGVSPDWTTGDPAWVAHKYKPASSFVFVEKQANERDTTTDPIETVSTVGSTRGGANLFGERFNDLKDLLRRYQMHSSFNVVVADIKVLGQCSVIIPMIISGLDPTFGTTSQINEIANRCREGQIPLIANGFRYARGSINFRLIVPTFKNVVVWVQHRPDRKIRSRSIIPCKEVTTAEAVANHGYASYLQLAAVNGVVEFNVPFYQPGVFALLQQPVITTTDDGYYMQLGELTLGFNFIDNKDITRTLMTLYYAMGDDMRFYTFQGFAPVVITDDIASVSVECEPQGPTWLSNMFTSATKEAVVGVKDDISDVVSKATSAAADVVTDRIRVIAEQTKDALTNAPSIADVFGSSTFRTILSQVGHCIINRDYKTAAWALCSILLDIGIIVYDQIASLMDKLTALIKALSREKTEQTKNDETVSGMQSKTPEEVEVAVEAMPQGPDKANDSILRAATGFITAIWTCICSAVSLKNVDWSKKGAWARALVKDIPDVTKSANSIFLFVKNMLSVVKDMYDYVIGLLYPNIASWRLAKEHYSMYKIWGEEAAALLHPVTRKQAMFDTVLQKRVFNCISQGNVLFNNWERNNAAPPIQYVLDLYKRLIVLGEDLTASGKNPFVRKLPFTLWAYGASGIGKSTIAHNICASLLKLQGIRVPTNMTCVVNPLSKFWDQCEHQPVLMVDDMYAVQSEPQLGEQNAMMFSVVSPVPLTPPKADIADKKMRYNPEIFYINSNYKFPVFSNMCMEAIYRRRDVLVEMVLRDINAANYTRVPGCTHCEGAKITETDPQFLKDFHHLEFLIAKNVCDSKTLYDGPFNYEDFMKELTEKYILAKLREEKMYQERLKTELEMFEGIDFSGCETLASKLEAVRKTELKIEEEIASSTVKNWLYETGCRMPLNLNFISKLCTSIYKRKVSTNPFLGNNEPTPSTSNVHCEPQMNGIPGCRSADAVMADMDKVLSVSDMVENARTTANVTAMQKYIKRSSEAFAGDQYRFKTDLALISSVKDVDALAYWQSHKMCNFMGKLMVASHNDPMTVLFNEMLMQGESALQSDTPVKSIMKNFHRLFDANDEFYKKFFELYVKKGELPNCWHLLKGPKLIYNNSSYYCSADNTTTSNGECSDCMMHKLPFRVFWYVYWLNHTPQRLVEYKAGDVSLLPEYFHDLIVFPSELDWNSGIQTMLDKFWTSTKYAGNKIFEWCRRIYGWIENNFQKVIIGISVLCTVILPTWLMVDAVQTQKELTKIATKDPSKMKLTTNGNGGYQWVPAESGHAYAGLKPGKVVSKIATAVKVEPQMETQQVDAAIKRIRDNWFDLTAEIPCDTGTQYLTVTCLVIKDRDLLVIRHYDDQFRTLPPNTRFYGKFSYIMDKCVYKYGVPFDYLNAPIVWYNRDNKENAWSSNVGILRLPLEFKQSKDLTRFIAHESDHTSFNGMGLLVTQNNRVCDNLKIRVIQGQPHVVRSEDGLPVVLEDMYTYTMNGKGMCGSVLLGSNLQHPIIGIHVAGVPTGAGYGISEPISVDMFTDLPTRQNKVSYTEALIPVLSDVEFSKVNLTTAVYPLGVVPSGMASPQSGLTSYVPSLIHGVFEVRTEPNPLAKSDRRLPKGSNPMIQGCEWMGRPPLSFPDKILKNSAEDLTSIILGSCQPVRAQVGVLSLAQSIVGIPLLEGYEPLEFSTSEGYPLRSLRPSGAHGKKWLFTLRQTDLGYDLDGIHPELSRLISLDNAMRVRGIKPFTVFADCLKDTCIPCEKCRVPGKTRIFSISPVQFTIVFKQYFGDFLAAYQNARFSAEHGIGVNCDSMEWTQLAGLLTKHGGRIITGDYKNFGPGLMRSAVRYACDIVLEWYKHYSNANDNDTQIRKILLDEIVDAYHLCGDLVYTCPCGIPSGSPITTPLNSLVNSIYIRCVYQMLTNKGFSYLHDNATIITYGDDVCIGVSDELSEIMNTVTMADIFAKYNIVFTDQDKGGAEVKHRDIHSATFLKRGFKQHPWRNGKWLAPLDIVSIEGAANWIHKKGSLIENTLVNARMTVELSYGHGPEVYYDYQCKIAKALCDAGLEAVRVDSWKDRDIKIFDM